MKRNKKYQLQLALSACLLMPVANLALAEEKAEAPDTSNWACKFCVVNYGWFGDLDFGMLYVSDPTPKFADYRGLIDDGAYADLGGVGGYRGEQGHYFDYYAKNLALDSRIVDLEAGKQGTYVFRANYQEIPRYLGHGTETPFQGVGSDTLVIPDGWTPSPEAALDYAKLESTRTISGAGPVSYTHLTLPTS